MQVSLIITTYNWCEALEITILSAFNQTILPNEIIIADDGSTKETKLCIDKYSKKSEIPIIHSWQEDKGFRLARSRNLAIAKSSYEYIIIVDGDMILHKNFIQDHLNCSKRGFFLQGSRVILDAYYSKNILNKKSIQINIFSPHIKNKLNGIRIPFISKILCSKNRRTHKGIRGCNFSFFKSDAILVNGFNEDFVTWGREDSEFIERLYNNKILRKNIKFSAIQYHIYHKEGSSNNMNDKYLNNTISKKLKWCDNGINKHL